MQIPNRVLKRNRSTTPVQFQGKTAADSSPANHTVKRIRPSDSLSLSFNIRDFAEWENELRLRKFFALSDIAVISACRRARCAVIAWMQAGVARPVGPEREHLRWIAQVARILPRSKAPHHVRQRILVDCCEVQMPPTLPRGVSWDAIPATMRDLLRFRPELHATERDFDFVPPEHRKHLPRLKTFAAFAVAYYKMQWNGTTWVKPGLATNLAPIIGFVNRSELPRSKKAGSKLVAKSQGRQRA
jgi:hypothetical protein